MTAPNAAAIRTSVLGGLGTRSGLGPSMVLGLTFEPSIGIVAGRIDKLGLDIRSFRVPIMESIRRVMVPSIRKNFEEGGRPDSWEPLSEYTLATRAKQGSGEKILDRTGTLARAASQINIWDVTMVAAVIRDLPERAWYGKVHQAGLSKGSHVSRSRAGIKTAQEIMKQARASGGGGAAGEIPARPFLMFQDEDELAIQEIFLLWLGERVARTWG